MTIKILLLVTVAILLLITSCKKTPSPKNQNKDIMQLTNTEQTLLGKWQMTKNETYEVDGIDSSGQYICSLISIQNGDSTCSLQFKHTYNPQLLDKQLTGIGSIEECDPNQLFLWNARQQNKLEILLGHSYELIYLNSDSVAFSRVYTKDILQLKSVVSYKRCK